MTVATGWTAQAHFAGDANAGAVDSSVRSFSTKQHSTSVSIHLDPLSVLLGSPYGIAGTLRDTTLSTTLASKSITFTATSPIVIPDAVTDANGLYTTSGLTAPTVPGVYNIQSHFAGDTLYKPFNSSTPSLTVIDPLIKTTLTLNPITSVPWGRPATLAGTLKDISGSPIGGKTIRFDGNGVTSSVTATTDSSGSFSVTTTSPSTVSSWSVQAHFDQDSTYHNSDSTIRGYNTNPHSTTLTISLNPSSPKAGNKYAVSGVLRDATLSIPLGSKQITFTADSPITIAPRTTDNSGIYSASGLTAPTKGTYKIQAAFAGDTLYQSVSSSIVTLTPK
jgi:hypothetical protein